MAEELRGEHFTNGQSTSGEGFSVYTNETNSDQFIRAIGMSTFLEGDDGTICTARLEVAKEKQTFETTDNINGVRCRQALATKVSTNGAQADAANNWWYFAKGQYVLRPGETIFHNTSIGGTPSSMSSDIEVWYHD